jgi:hypothetical protein
MNAQSTSSSGEKQDNEMTFYVKGDKVVIPVPGAAKSDKVIFHTNSGDVYSVMTKDQQTMVIKMNLTKLGKMGNMSHMLGIDKALPIPGQSEDWKVEKTGITKKINGYPAEKVIAENKEMEMELWMSSAFPFDFNDAFKHLGTQADWSDFGIEGFPVEVNAKNKQNGEASFFQMQAKANDLADDMFDYPAGVPVTDLNMMIDQMMKTSDPAALELMLKQMMPADR